MDWLEPLDVTGPRGMEGLRDAVSLCRCTSKVPINTSSGT